MSSVPGITSSRGRSYQMGFVCRFHFPVWDPSVLVLLPHLPLEPSYQHFTLLDINSLQDLIRKHIHPTTTMTKDTSTTSAEPQPTEAAPASPYYGMYGHYWKSNRDVPPTKWL